MSFPRLFQILRVFSSRELNWLEKYLASPAFNSREDLPALLKAYQKQAPGTAPDPETTLETGLP